MTTQTQARGTPPATPSMVSLLRRYLAPQSGMAAIMAGLLLTAIGLQLVVPQLLRRFIDGALGGAEPRLLTTLALLFLGAAVLTQVLNAAATGMASKLEAAGYTPVPVDLSELKKGGGSVKCCILELRA